MSPTSRSWFAAVAGIVAFLLAYLFLMAWSCNDVGGVPSWQRCSSVMGTPGFSVEDWGLDNDLNTLIPIVPGVVVGVGVWWLSGRRRSDDS